MPSRPVKVFYGVGGAGKSALRAKAVDECRARMSDQGGYPLAFAHVDLDSDRITPAYPIFDLFAGRLRAALKAAGCPLPLFDVYCLAWHARGMSSGTFSAEQVQDFLGTHQKASEVAGSWWAPLTDFATSLKGVDLVLKAGIAFRTAWHTRRYAVHFPNLELAELSEADFMQYAHHVLAHDLLAFLDAQRERNGHPKALCITIDGFERIQSQVCAHDAQWALQELCSRIATADPQPRCGFVLFGRNRLQWRELYDRREDLPEDTWDALLEQHLVGGLGETDAEYFLDQAEAWYTARAVDPRSAEILEILSENRKAILDAAEDLADDQPARSFHPYTLDLALRQIDSHRDGFNASTHLGRGHKELQARFLRYMDEGQRSAMQALALALTFDHAVFRLLIKEDLIKGIPVQGFHNLVDPANSHILPAGPQVYRFHSKMQEALLAHLHDQPSGPKQAADVIASLVAHYSAQLAEAVRRHDVAAMQAAYVRAADILLAHADTGLLDVAVFGPAFAALDKAIPWGLLARPRLATWTRAEGVFRARLSADAEKTLGARGEIAYWTGESGDARTALALIEALLPDQRRVLGPDHPDILKTRANLATWTGQAGDAHAALALFEALLLDQQRVLGPDHPDTLTTRNNIATWIGECGDAGRALALFEALLPDQQRVLGPDHPETLRTRNNIAFLIGKTGDLGTALSLFEKLLPDQQRVLGPDHPDTLTTCNNIASFIGWTGDVGTALSQFENLLRDQQRVLGPDHPDTLRTRNNIAGWTGMGGDTSTALTLLEALLPDLLRVLGPDHPLTLGTRHNIAGWTGMGGDASTALTLFEALLPDLLRVLGPDHPHTLNARHNIAYWAGKCGDVAKVLALSEALLPDQQCVLGPNHPDTCATADRIADLQQRLHPDPQTTDDPPGQPPSPARNAPCPCGSGKRFKHCHGQRG
ncbi:tetratricopeptide repeat protein [Zoogloea sp. 1C4]|uniref:tetratricopeptide repeat protein n=1 Tax=Zoogloea sp. 1C4 TaxID=2570190 RepID=UPI001884A932|nr:tetratricopeptide repeat protein [Zoogloea sp. 1C4]